MMQQDKPVVAPPYEQQVPPMHVMLVMPVMPEAVQYNGYYPIYPKEQVLVPWHV